MFKDLLSNLPYNNNVRSDILFYSARLREESSVRLLGFVFLLLAALVQVSAVLYHPQKSFADDPSLNGLTPAENARCSVTASLVPGSTDSIRVTTLEYGGSLTPASYHYDLNADGSVDAIDNNTSTTDTHTFNSLPAGTHTVLVNILLRSGPQYNNGIYHFTTCQTSITINPPEQARVILSKTVSSNSAKAGDQLVFKLSTQNPTSSDYKNYSGRDDFSSVLQYASIANPSELSSQGLVLDANHFLNWTTLNLKANTTEVKTITVKVNSALPNRTSSNCQITNTYGNQVTVNLACPTPGGTEPGPTTPQQVNQTASNLPNTGPGTTVAIAFVVASVAGYFFSRSRIMARELELVELTGIGGEHE